MSGEEDKYYFPETLNQQDRYLGLPLDELIIVAPLILLGVLNDMSTELTVIAGLLWALVRYRTVRRHRGSFITITQGIKDFSASKEAEAAWNNSSTKITLLQDARAFKQYLSDNPDQFSDMEKEVIRGFQPALQTGYSSLLISAGEFSSFHRLFVDPITRAMFSSRGEDFAYMQNAQKAGATSEEAAYLLAEKKFGDELRELEEWVKAA